MDTKSNSVQPIVEPNIVRPTPDCDSSDDDQEQVNVEKLKNIRDTVARKCVPIIRSE